MVTRCVVTIMSTVPRPVDANSLPQQSQARRRHAPVDAAPKWPQLRLCLVQWPLGWACGTGPAHGCSCLHAHVS